MVCGQMSSWQSSSVKVGQGKLTWKFGQNWVRTCLRYCWYGQISQRQMLCGQISLWQLYCTFKSEYVIVYQKVFMTRGLKVVDLEKVRILDYTDTQTLWTQMQ